MEITKGNQSETKNTISEMKTLEGVNILDAAEDQISNLEIKVVEDTQSEQ